jgi:hypothetical protein
MNVKLAVLGVLGLSAMSIVALGAIPGYITYPGNVCVEHDPSPEISYSTAQPFGSPDALLDDATSGVFICPITRAHGNANGFLGNMFAVVADRNTNSGVGADVSCYVGSCAFDQSSCLTTPVVTTAGQTGKISLSLGSVQGYSWGSARLDCFIPGKTAAGASGVVSYIVTSSPSF